MKKTTSFLIKRVAPLVTGFVLLVLTAGSVGAGSNKEFKCMAAQVGSAQSSLFSPSMASGFFAQPHVNENILLERTWDSDNKRLFGKVRNRSSIHYSCVLVYIELLQDANERVQNGRYVNVGHYKHALFDVGPGQSQEFSFHFDAGEIAGTWVSAIRTHLEICHLGRPAQVAKPSAPPSIGMPPAQPSIGRPVDPPRPTPAPSNSGDSRRTVLCRELPTDNVSAEEEGLYELCFSLYRNFPRDGGAKSDRLPLGFKFRWPIGNFQATFEVVSDAYDIEIPKLGKTQCRDINNSVFISGISEANLSGLNGVTLIAELLNCKNSKGAWEIYLRMSH